MLSLRIVIRYREDHKWQLFKNMITVTEGNALQVSWLYLTENIKSLWNFKDGFKNRESISNSINSFSQQILSSFGYDWMFYAFFPLFFKKGKALASLFRLKKKKVLTSFFEATKHRMKYFYSEMSILDGCLG